MWVHACRWNFCSVFVAVPAREIERDSQPADSGRGAVDVQAGAAARVNAAGRESAQAVGEVQQFANWASHPRLAGHLYGDRRWHPHSCYCRCAGSSFAIIYLRAQHA